MPEAQPDAKFKFGLKRDIAVRIYIGLAQRIISGELKLAFGDAATQASAAAKFIMAETLKG